MAFILAVYAGAGLLLSMLAVPLIRRKVRPNPFYGVRIRQTLDNPEVWYPVNEYVARRLFVVGLLCAAASVLLFLLPGMKLDTYALACLAVTLVGFAVCTVQTVRYLRTLGK